jgi:hypothetical protein
MAHFAKINSEKKVLAVLTLNNSDALNGDGVEDETVGQQYLEKHNNWPANQWIQTSYNTHSNTHKLGGTPFRGNFAIIAGEWDEANQMFWYVKPYPSWVKNTSEGRWNSPIGNAPALTEAEKEAHSNYQWNEDAGSWDLNT